MSYEDVPIEILSIIQKGAQHTVTSMKGQGVEQFGYNELSVQFLSNVITDERLHMSEQAKKTIPDIWGAFLGEALIKRLGGKWIKLGNQYGVLIGKSHICFPFEKVHKQIINGEIDSIYGFYLSTLEINKNQKSAGHGA